MEDDKIPNFLLPLSPEEKKKAKEYVSNRLRLVDDERLESLQKMLSSARGSLKLVKSGRAVFENASNRYAEVMKTIYDEAIVGFAQLIQDSNRAYSAKSRELKEKRRAKAAQEAGESGTTTEESDIPEGCEALLLNVTKDEIDAAEDYIQKRIDEMEFQDLDRFRGATHKLLTWWESLQGQTEGLLLNQYGETGSAKGRVAIRNKKDELQQQVLNPFKSWFQSLNVFYLKKKKQEYENSSP